MKRGRTGNDVETVRTTVKTLKKPKSKTRKATFTSTSTSPFVVPSARRPEVGAIDTLLISPVIPVTAAGSITVLNPCAEGSDTNNRKGREIILRSVEVRGRLYSANPSGAHAGQLARVLLVYDAGPRGTIATTQDIISDVSNTTIGDANPSGFLFNNLNNKGRFKILGEQTFTFGEVGTANIETNEHFLVSMYRKFNLPAAFKDSATGMASILQGAIYLVVLGTNTAASSAFYSFTGSTRVRFIDP